jgi:hypothetical protein
MKLAPIHLKQNWIIGMVIYLSSSFSQTLGDLNQDGLVNINDILEYPPEPTEYNLNSIYPNPFNPITNITYELPDDSYITISIYDLAGRKIIDLVNGTIQAGRFNTTWNAEQYSSGVYFIKMKTESFTKIQKVILVK